MKRTFTILILIGAAVFNQLYAQWGIGIADPRAPLHVVNGNVLFSNNGNIPGIPAAPPITGAGRRMMWYADKAAFRVGTVSGDQWDQANVGNYSTALGLSTKAVGAFSASIGYSSGASFLGSGGDYSTQMGYGAVGIGAYSTALGELSVAHGDYSTAFGNASAEGLYSVAIGMDQVKAIGSASMAMGINTSADSFAETAFGSFNTTYTPQETTAWNASDRLFVIGNARYSLDPRSDAFSIMKSGEVYIGNSTDGGVPHTSTSLFTVFGDAAKPGGGSWLTFSDYRVKKDIQKYRAGLAEILKVNPVQFQYNGLSGYTDTTRNYVGVIAQEIEKIFPSTVSVVRNDPSVPDKRVYDSSELVYALINSIKELESKSKELIKNNERLSAELKNLEKQHESATAWLDKIELIVVPAGKEVSKKDQ